MLSWVGLAGGGGQGRGNLRGKCLMIVVTCHWRHCWHRRWFHRTTGHQLSMCPMLFQTNTFNEMIISKVDHFTDKRENILKSLVVLVIYFRCVTIWQLFLSSSLLARDFRCLPCQVPVVVPPWSWSSSCWCWSSRLRLRLLDEWWCDRWCFLSLWWCLWWCLSCLWCSLGILFS